MAEQAGALIELGCTRGQGYLYSRPVTAQAIPALLFAPSSNNLKQLVVGS